ncbi:hypothetical protein [Bacillus phage YungSlug]|nr:hypothetical protein [Bacillus phage YungSlug]
MNISSMNGNEAINLMMSGKIVGINDTYKNKLFKFVDGALFYNYKDALDRRTWLQCEISLTDFILETYYLYQPVHKDAWVLGTDAHGNYYRGKVIDMDNGMYWGRWNDNQLPGWEPLKNVRLLTNSEIEKEQRRRIQTAPFVQVGREPLKWQPDDIVRYQGGIFIVMGISRINPITREVIIERVSHTANKKKRITVPADSLTPVCLVENQLREEDM